ncbi:hypothetical protein Ocin01_04625 [Orchesella cincta]|uniref:Uncharacterized protein n=1 Tax=Orchesella cincta TaxID=48709 RepID=A0A1D2N9X1_ORCCI|nr:hypothetical protein Ocin01_04625 [Orchesella cincta]
MHSTLAFQHVALIIAISLYVQVDTRGYIFHPQPWILEKRTLYDPSTSSSEDKVTVASSPNTESRSVEAEDEDYLRYSSQSNSADSSNDGSYRSDNTEPVAETESREQQKTEAEQEQRNRYRDEPIEDDVEFEDSSNEFREQNTYDYSDHSPYQYHDEGGDGYNEENYDQQGQSNSQHNDGLQLQTNVEPYDDEVAAKEENSSNQETYSAEYTQHELETNNDNNNNNNVNENNSNAESESNNAASSPNASSDSSKNDKNDDDDDDNDDDYDDYNDDEDSEEEYNDIAYDDKGKGKGKRNRNNNQEKKVTAPFWGAQDYRLGNPKGHGWAVQGPPVYYEEGEPQWPPEQQGGRGKGKGKGDRGRGDKGDKGGKKGGKGKKGKKGKKGGRGRQKGWPHPGWGGWERIGNGGWGEWPKGWISSANLDTGGQKWVDGKGWTGETGAPWIPKREMIHHWGHPLGWGKMEELGRGGKKGKGGKGGKKKGGKKGKKGGKGKKGKKCKKRKGRGGKGGKKGGKKGRGCGGDSGWGWPKPHFLKLKPLPPRGSQVWLKSGGGWPAKPIGGWHPSRGWDILRKVTGGWVLPDLVGVVNLNG